MNSVKKTIINGLLTLLVILIAFDFIKHDYWTTHKYSDIFGLIYLDRIILTQMDIPISGRFLILIFNVLWTYAVIEGMVRTYKSASQYACFILYRAGFRGITRYYKKLLCKNLLLEMIPVIMVNFSILGAIAYVYPIESQMIRNLLFVFIKNAILVYAVAYVYMIGSIAFSSALINVMVTFIALLLVLDAFFQTRFILMSSSLRVNVCYIAFDVIMFLIFEKIVFMQLKRRKRI